MYRRINPYKLFHGSFIPEWLEERPTKEISLGAKLIYARLSRYAGKGGDCFPKLDEISKATGICLRQVKHYIKELKKLKLIESVQVGKKCSNRYFFLEHPWMIRAMYVESEVRDSALHGKSEVQDSALPMEVQDSALPQKENQERESNISPLFKNRWEEYSKPFESKSKTGECDKKLNRLSLKDYSHLLNQRDEYFKYVKSKRKKWNEYPMKNAATFLTLKYWKNAEWKCDEMAECSIYDINVG